MRTLDEQNERIARFTDRDAIARRRGDLLWYILDDVVHGRVSALSEVDVILKALANEQPRQSLTAVVNVELLKRWFRELPRHAQEAALVVLRAEYEKNRR